MHERPLYALRNKPNSSEAAINLVHSGKLKPVSVLATLAPDDHRIFCFEALRH